MFVFSIWCQQDLLRNEMAVLNFNNIKIQSYGAVFKFHWFVTVNARNTTEIEN
jgi:hypothetical protein